MSNFDFLRKYQCLQYGIMFNGLIDLNFATIGYSKTDQSVYWNLALTDKLLSGDQVVEIEGVFKSLCRKPTFYFENNKSLFP